jgi:hypothetical protein
MTGNKAYYANRPTLKSKFVCKKSELKIYRTVLRPAVT